MSGTTSITIPEVSVTAQRQTSLNNPNAPSYANRPRLRVMSNGTEIPNCLAARVESNNHYQADRFSLSFVPALSGSIGTMAWWSTQKLIPVDIQLGLAQSTTAPSWTSMLTGVCDKLTMEPGRNEVSVEGRDLTANFLDNPNTGMYPNQSSSAIVSAIAAEHGMTAQVTSTSGTVGRYWADGRTISKHHKSGKVTTEWDLIVSLAKKEGYDAFVQGKVLYFQPPTAATSTPYVWQYKVDATGRQTGNIRDLKMDRILTVAKGLRVTVKSWNSKQARAFTKTASTAAPSSSTGGNSTAQELLVQMPNLTEDEAQAYVDNMQSQLALNDRLISASMPGDMLLTPRTLVLLQGTGTSFDQLYYAVSVTREVTVGGGFVMHVSGKNKSADDAETAFANQQSSGAASATDGGDDSGPDN